MDNIFDVVSSENDERESLIIKIDKKYLIDNSLKLSQTKYVQCFIPSDLNKLKIKEEQNCDVDQERCVQDEFINKIGTAK